MEAIVDRLMSSGTYAENLRDRPMSSHNTHPETMQVFLEHVDEEYGGVERAARPDRLDRRGHRPTARQAARLSALGVDQLRCD